MTREEKDFIIYTIKELMSWTEYVTPYYAEKHNLQKDINDAWTSIKLLEKKDERD